MLLERTTRSLHPTNDGRAFYERCVRVIEELDEAKDAIARVDEEALGHATGRRGDAIARRILRRTWARSWIATRSSGSICRFAISSWTRSPKGSTCSCASAPSGTRGSLPASSARVSWCMSLRRDTWHVTARRVARPISRSTRASGTCATGVRRRSTSRTESASWQSRSRGPFNANDAQVLLELALAGHGIVALFDFIARDSLASGALVTVLDDHPSTIWPIHALYPKKPAPPAEGGRLPRLPQQAVSPIEVSSLATIPRAPAAAW